MKNQKQEKTSSPVKNFLGRMFALAATIFGVLALYLYYTEGLNIYNDDYSMLLFGTLGLGIVLAAVSVVVNIRACMFGSYLCFLVALIEFIVTQINYLAAVIYPMLVGTLVDDVSISASFIYTIVFCVGAFVTALIAGILTKNDFIYRKIFKERR